LVPRSIPDWNAVGSRPRVLRLRRFHAHNLNFEAAEVGMVVFADAIGEIDED
jgi:aminoglycoside/choline kinase family phosphotransferase